MRPRRLSCLHLQLGLAGDALEPLGACQDRRLWTASVSNVGTPAASSTARSGCRIPAT